MSSVRRVARRAVKLQEKIEKIKKSNLSAEEKEKAFKSLKKLIITTTIVVVAVALLMVIPVVMGILIGGNTGVIILVGALVAAIVLLIGYAFLAKNIFKDFVFYYDKVDNGFDGLDEQEINRLKPNQNEEALIKKYKAKSLLYIFILLLALGIEFYIVMKLELPLNSPILYIVTLVIFIIWFFFEDTCRVEIHRIKSGRYKRSFGFQCKQCKTVLSIPFSEMEKYMDAPTNEYGIRVTPCQNCSHLIPLYGLEVHYTDYKKYLEKSK